MADIAGTVCSVEDFLSTQEAKFYMSNNCSGEKEQFSLVAGRKYVIPYFQREIRWKEENMIELLKDIDDGSCFLGNIILTNTKHGEYEILDGQQRLTALLMITIYLHNTYEHIFIKKFDFCPIENQGFEKLMMLVENGFDDDKLSDKEKEELDESDIYKQKENYKHLWNAIEESKIINPEKVTTYWDKLRRCKLNVIVNNEKDSKSSIRYFLDVNVKGVKLDTEDIFKAYLFSNTASRSLNDDIFEKWKEIKRASIHLNSIKGKIYPLMLTISQYFYCDLYLSNPVRYKNLEFYDNFTLKRKLETSNGVTYQKGEHIIKTINDNKYMLKALGEMTEFLNFISDIIENDQPGQKQRELLRKHGKIEVDEGKIIYNFIKKIMLDTLDTPKVLVMKYVLDVMMNENSDRSDYKKIYGVYFLSILFVLFGEKKSSTEIYNIVRAKDWYTELKKQIKKYLNPAEFAMKQIDVQKSYTIKNNDQDDKFRCKSLATVYNFFEIKKDGANGQDCIGIKKGKLTELAEYVTNDKDYSIEHFVINDRGKYSINVGTRKLEDKYPVGIGVNSKSLFNFIFIPREHNSKMENMLLCDKMDYIEENVEINCEYSKMAYDIFRDTMKDFPEISASDTDDAAKRKWKDYYVNDFRNQYIECVKQIIENVQNKFHDMLNSPI